MVRDIIHMVGLLRSSVGAIFLLSTTSSLFIEHWLKLCSVTVISHTMVWLLTLAGCLCFSQQWLPWVGGYSRSGAGLYSWRAYVRPWTRLPWVLLLPVFGSMAHMGLSQVKLETAKWTEWTLIAFLSLACGMEEGAFFYYRLVLLQGGRLVQWKSLAF